jgi:hypothetical protein
MIPDKNDDSSSGVDEARGLRESMMRRTSVVICEHILAAPKYRPTYSAK